MIGVTFASAQGIIDVNRSRMPEGSSASTTRKLVRPSSATYTVCDVIPIDNASGSATVIATGPTWPSALGRQRWLLQSCSASAQRTLRMFSHVGCQPGRRSKRSRCSGDLSAVLTWRHRRAAYRPDCVRLALHRAGYECGPSSKRPREVVRPGSEPRRGVNVQGQSTQEDRSDAGRPCTSHWT